MILSIPYPAWIHPEIIPGVSFLRWYGLMYLVAFSIAYLLFRVQLKRGELQRFSPHEKAITHDEVLDFFTWSITGLLLGARIFATLVYESSWVYWIKPWLIFWPFSAEGQWTGLQGMSYHGGLIGVIAGGLLWCLVHKRNFLAWADTAVAGIPLGYTFGRLGNFFNAELYGRITDGPFGMIFPAVPLHDCFPAQEAWVQDFAARAGMLIPAGAQYVNLPRHPSQLYEALFEGVVLWLILWGIRNKKPFNGFILCCYMIGYGLVRFGIEYFRQPDYELGFRISTFTDSQIYRFDSLKNISTGQIFCFVMIVCGCAGLAVLRRLHKKWQAAG